jgi:hypothetical protein
MYHPLCELGSVTDANGVLSDRPVVIPLTRPGNETAGCRTGNGKAVWFHLKSTAQTGQLSKASGLG